MYFKRKEIWLLTSFFIAKNGEKMKKLMILSIMLMLLVSMSGVIASTDTSNNLPQTVEFNVGNSLLLDYDSGFLKLISITAFEDSQGGSELHANFELTTDDVSVLHAYYEDDTFKMGFFEITVEEVDEEQVVLEFDRSEIIENPIVCCKTSDINAEPHFSYDMMTKAQCVETITIATISRSVVDDDFCKVDIDPIVKYPVEVEFEVGDSILLDDTNGILELTTIDNVVGVDSVADTPNIYVYRATFTFESNAGIGAQYNLYEGDTFSVGPFSLYVQDISDDELTLEITRTDILVDDHVPGLISSPSERPVCCKISPVVPNPVPKFVWVEEDECSTCKKNALGFKECMVGVNKEIVDDDYCTVTTEPVPQPIGDFPRYVKVETGSSLSLDEFDGTLEFLDVVVGVSAGSEVAISSDLLAQFRFVGDTGINKDYSLQAGDQIRLDSLTFYLKDIVENGNDFVASFYVTEDDYKPTTDTETVQSENLVCCKITPVVQYPVSKFSWTEEDYCKIECRTNLATGIEECMVGASREIVKDYFCVESQIPRNEEPSTEIITVGRVQSSRGNMEASTTSDEIGSVRMVPGNKKPMLTSTSGIAVPSIASAENGFSMRVRSTAGVEEVIAFASTDDLWNTMTDEKQVKVKTRKTFVNDKEGLSIETDDGKKEIKILPSQASDKAKEVLTEIFGEIEIKEENGKVFYEFNEERKVKVLGFIPVNAKYSAQVDAESGELIKSSKPWFAAISSK